MNKKNNIQNEGSNRIREELQRLLTASITGDFDVTLDSKDLSDDETKNIGILNEALENYKAAIEYDMMKYKLTSDALGVGLWDMDVVNDDPGNRDNKLIWSQEIRTMLGFTDEQDFPNLFSSIIDMLHPQDRDRVMNAFTAHVTDRTGKTPFDVEYRCMLKNGEYRHFHSFGTTLRKKDGTPLRVAGAMEDIDDRVRTQEALRRAELNEKKQIQENLIQREEMLKTLNDAAIVFLSQHKKPFVDIMTQGILLIADAAGLDRFSIWKNFERPDGLHIGQIYRWDRESGGTTEPTPGLEDLLYSKSAPNWESMFNKGESLNSPVCLLDQNAPETAMLNYFKVVSVFVTPVFIDGILWGSAMFEDRHKQRYFDDNDTELMRTAAFLCTNTVIMNEKTQKALENVEILKRREEMLDVLNKMAQILLSHENESFNDVMSKGINAIAGALNVNRVAVYRVLDEKGKMGQIYLWIHGNTVVLDDELLELPDVPPVRRWLKILKKGIYVHNRVGDVAKDQAAFMSIFGIKSILFVPILIKGEFWGVITLENLNDDKYFDEDCIDLMRSAAHLCASAVVRNEVECEIETALRNAENASRAKSDFLAKMSHEIRTPMNAILGITEIQMSSGMLPADTEEALSKIYDSGNLLMGIINDILDLSKIEADKLEISPIKYDISSLINDTVQLNRMRYENKPIKFTIRLDEKTPHYLIGDELRIKQILNNLLSNAYKYTDEGEIELSVSAIPLKNGQLIVENGKLRDGCNKSGNSQLSNAGCCTEDDVVLIFTVRDTGQGMTEEQVENLFIEYMRFNLEANRTTVGTGLGLSITKSLVELMNGDISVISQVGGGSTFTVRIPQKQVGTTVCGAGLAERLLTARYQSSAITKRGQFVREYMPYGSVLVVDDVESNIYVIKGMLLPYGLHIETASSGFEVIKKIENGSTYDIIFMDHMMPLMDGIEATKTIRNMGYTGIVVALTANALVGQAEIFLKNGFDGYMAKPIDSRELNHVLNEHIRSKQAPEVIEAAQRELLEKKGNKTSVQAEDATDISSMKKFVVSDTEKAIRVLDEIFAKPNPPDEADMELYTVTVHGMKSSLLNIGEKDLSAEAAGLEAAGKNKAIDIIRNETPAFIDALRALLDNIKEPEKTGSDEVSGTNILFLREKATEVEEACKTYNSNGARESLNDLMQRTWPDDITEKLDEISMHLLHSDFDMAAETAAEVIEIIKARY